jgi:RNA recognition motif-containing protein
LEDDTTPQDLTDSFQVFSKQVRDNIGSIEMVTCESGLPTGRAYVGFDSVGEAQAAMKELKGAIRINNRVAKLRLVRDRIPPGKTHVPISSRPERQVEDLLDDLQNWEQHADPDDLAYVLEHGVSKDVLSEALRGIRYHNQTFGPLDSGMPSENLETGKARGEEYRELVRMYVSTLRECIATPDDVGMMYESLHMEGQPIDLSIFEQEKVRQKKIAEKYE